ncbi:MAG: FKBP-type peptidyl-prolyl cis-trans isomerase N-terminal domain-containing protein, partial [Bacteroidota bacterium]
MKKFFVLFAVLTTIVVQAQKTTSKPPLKKTSSSLNPLKNLSDSVSYAIGLNVAKFYAEQGIKTLNPELVARAIRDMTAKKKTLLTDEQANNAVMRFLNPNLFKVIEKGETFLAQNKKKPGVKTTASGLQYEVMTQGTGVQPLATDTVEVNYAGT